MDISSKLLSGEKNLLHQLIVKSMPVKNIKRRKNYDIIKIKKNYNDNQKAVSKIKLDKSIINSRQNIVHDDINIQFDNDTVNIKAVNVAFSPLIRKGFFSFHARYQIIIPHKVTLTLKIKFSTRFYENSVLPQIERLKGGKIKAGQRVYIRRPQTAEDYRKKDIYESDRETYRYSPNSDGGRSRHEILSGNFSGESRYRKR